MDYDRKRSLELLRIGSDIPEAQFREGQEEAIRHVVEGRGKLLVVQRTGWGKSFVYFIATKLLREGGGGPVLLISPLLALMRNQIAAAERMGVRAATMNSNNRADWDDVKTQASRGEIDILLISPERLANDDFWENFLVDMAGQVAMLVIDEAHCISDWGHDFRPDYRRIRRMIQFLPPNVQALGTTATANNRVLDDLTAVLGSNIQIMRGDLNRPSLLLQTIQMPSQAERLAWLAERLEEIPGSGIIYTLTKRDAGLVANWLQAQGLNAKAYTADSDNREELEQALLDDRVKALVATVALGMGYDKPDLTFVIHYQMPGSVVAYYQQVGRAGRGCAAYGVLLGGGEDRDITNYFIKSAFPTRLEVHQIMEALGTVTEGLSEPEILSKVNISRGRLSKAIKILALESPAPIVKQGRKWRLTPGRLSDAFWERVERLTSLRREEQAQMQEYLALESGHMEFLINALDGNPERVRTPDLLPLRVTASSEIAQQAVEFLRHTNISIEPRKQWALRRKTIPEDQRAEVGRALCYWGDPGWGDMVDIGKYEDRRFSDELVRDSIRLIRKWSPQPTLVWVTCIPSQHNSGLVSAFAQRLATGLGLPFHSALTKIDARPEQKGMKNSIQQWRNVEGSLAVVGANLMTGPVLLVDDMVDSRWTFTVAATLLRNSGCEAVFPFALADTGSG